MHTSFNKLKPAFCLVTYKVGLISRGLQNAQLIWTSGNAEIVHRSCIGPHEVPYFDAKVIPAKTKALLAIQGLQGELWHLCRCRRLSLNDLHQFWVEIKMCGHFRSYLRQVARFLFLDGAKSSKSSITDFGTGSKAESWSVSCSQFVPEAERKHTRLLRLERDKPFK